MKKVLVVVLVMILALTSFAGCGEKDEVKKGTFVKVSKQTDALMEVASGTADVAIIDSIAAGAYTSKGTYEGKLEIVSGKSFADEFYGIGFRDGSPVTVQNVNAALYQLQESGKIEEIAKKYDLTESLVDIPKTEMSTESDAEWEKLKAGEIKVGYTIFAPIAYEEGGELVGYDIDLASEVFEILGIDYVFEIIDWDTKGIAIKAGNIDCVWNGFTIKESLENEFDFSTPYLANKQVAVVKAGESKNFTSDDDYKTANIVAEAGSAGAAIAEGIIG